MALTIATVGGQAQAGVDPSNHLISNRADTGCESRPRQLAPASAPAVKIVKSMALLGGMASALEAIRSQQNAIVPAEALTNLQLAGADTSSLAPTPGSNAAGRPICHRLVPSQIDVVPGARSGLIEPVADPANFLGSKRVSIGRTLFDNQWTRVRSETLSGRAARRYLGAHPSLRLSALSRVNRLVNQRIRYTEDSDQYGVPDYWAGARKTLETGKGDCEDLALVKLQLLAAAGVPRHDMILTIARDLVRNADHAVLIVKTDAGWRMLDNATDEVLDAAPSHDYRPILSFGNQGNWLHGV